MTQEVIERALAHFKHHDPATVEVIAKFVLDSINATGRTGRADGVWRFDAADRRELDAARGRADAAIAEATAQITSAWRADR